MASTNIIDIIIKATNKTRQALREPISDLGDLQGALVGASAMWAAAGSAALAAGVIMFKQATEAGDKALEMSQKLGITTEAFTTLEFAARQSNLSSEQFEKGMQKLATTAGNAAVGNKEATDSFRAIGVSVTDAHGRLKPMDQILLEVADGFQRMPDGAMKSKAAVDLLGKAGADMVPLLNQGAAGISGLQGRARELGLEISGSTAQASDQFNDNLAQLKDSSTGLGRTFTADILPGLNAILDGFIKGQGLGTAWNFVLGTLGLAISGVLKIIMSLVVEIDAAIEKSGARLAQLAATAAGLATDGFRGAVNAWKAGSEEMGRISQSAADRQAAIWTGTQVGPSAPKGPSEADLAAAREAARKAAEEKERLEVEAKRRALEEIRLAQEEARLAFETMRAQQFEAVKQMELAEVEARIATLDQKRIMNNLELEEYKTLQNRKVQLDAERVAKQKRLDQDRQASYDKMLTMLVSLSGSKNAALVAVSKAAGIAQATIDTYKAANLALASIPPPFSFAVAGTMITAGLANVAAIAGVPGFAAGGVVPGTDYSGDRRVIRVNSAEEVMTTEDRRATTTALIGALEALRGGGGPGRAQLLLDGRTLGEVIWEGTMNGTIQIHPRAVVAG